MNFTEVAAKMKSPDDSCAKAWMSPTEGHEFSRS
jgi:hypothetical protein